MRTLKASTSLFLNPFGLSRALHVAPLVLLLGAGCAGEDPPKDDMAMGGADLASAPRDMARPGPGEDLAISGDLAGTRDLASTSDLAGTRDLASPTDMSSKPDLSGGTPDLSGPSSDMAVSPVVTGLPTCTITGVTADAVFADVASTACASGMCHNTGTGGLMFTSGATFKSAVVGVAAKQVVTMSRVTASNIDASYIMYKLTGQHVALGGRGEAMPKGGMRLSDASLCKFIVWIKEGAK